MADVESIALVGAPGSPYTRKMLALLRYRRIPYHFIVSGSAAAEALPKPKVQLLPTFYLPDASGELEAVVDSTPIIRRLERSHLGRTVLPPDPVLAFIDFLLEDYADEWLTKAMFHYRWSYPDDIRRAGEVLPRWRNLTGTAEEIAPLSEYVRERQIGRLYVVGSNETTAPVIEDSYKRFLDLLTAHLANGPFLLGARPAASDFAVFGQLTALTGFDPTPMAEAYRRAPGVCAWVGVVEDLSGLMPDDEDWVSPDALPDTLTQLLAEVGRVYAPVLLANAAAVDAGADEVRAEVDGRPWVQKPFPYQAKCLQWLRQEYARLDGAHRTRVDALLAESGCHTLVARAGSA